MTYTKRAIQLAIEGKYQHPNRVNYLSAEMALTLLDPLFWVALGEALGWETRKCEDCERWTKDGMSILSRSQNKWHDLIDTLAAGKSIEHFFTKLLEKYDQTKRPN